MMGFQRIGAGVYRALGRLVAQALGAFDFVETVYLRRTTATGEVSLGRSDIDLTVVLARPMISESEGQRMLGLVRCFRTLKALAPVLGECESGTLEELLRSYRADPYRASIDRRTALTVYGESFEIPDFPIRPSDALTWLAIWLAHYLPWAMRARSVRNMRKFAVEMWNASLTATGDIVEPYATRTLAATAWREQSGDAFPLRPSADVEEIFSASMALLGETHRRLCAPVAEVAETRLHRTDSNELALLPDGVAPPPVEAGIQRTFVGTPRALDLLVQHVNPRIYQRLPDEVIALGIRRPGYCEWLDFSRRFATDPRLLRRPGFVTPAAVSYYAPELIRPGRQAARTLRAGETPVWMPQREEGLRGRPPGFGEYYSRVLPELYGEAEAAWRDLDECSGASRR